MPVPVRILRGPSLASWMPLAGALALVAGGGCERFVGAETLDCGANSSCAGDRGSGGASLSSTGGGRVYAGGALSAGGQGGEAGFGMAGEPVALGGGPTIVTPAVVEVRMGGRTLPLEGPLLGVRTDAAIDIEFNVDMEMYTVITAYSSDQEAIRQDEVTFEPSGKRRITIVPNMPLAYPSVADADAARFTFALSSVAESDIGLPLAPFSASFEVMKRAHGMWPLDLKRSAGSIAIEAHSAKAGFSETSDCPLFDYPPELTAAGGKGEPNAPAGFVSTGTDGTVAIYSYPLAPILEAEDLERAVLILSKWPYAHWDADIAIYSTLEDEMEEAPFQVSALTDGPLNAARATEDALAVMKTTSGEVSEPGFGTFQFDATSWLQEALSRGDRAVAFRLEFEDSQGEYPLQTCAALVLKMDYLVR
jgi:hypothetical protein